METTEKESPQGKSGGSGKWTHEKTCPDNFSQGELKRNRTFYKPSLVELLHLQPGTKERHGPCPFCGGRDRFIVFANGRGWCRLCHWRGDSIQLLRDRDGLSFREAQRRLGLDTICSPSTKRRATVHRFALAAAKRSYTDWQRRIFRALIDQYRELHSECDIAEIAYRAIHRVPDLYDEKERRYWTYRLALLYDRIAVLEHDLDLLTYDCHEAARFDWWTHESEVSHG